MENSIGFTSRFTLIFKCRKDQCVAIDQLLEDNGYKTVKMVRVPFDNWYEYRVGCCLRTAELLRQLIKNYKVYE